MAYTNKEFNMASLRYWVVWTLLLLGLVYGIHRYFEYRNQELDRRLERIK